MFGHEQYSVNESDKQVTVELKLSRPANRSITVGIRAIPNTAQGIYIVNFHNFKDICVSLGNNLDFNSTRSSVTFGPTDTLGFLNISITDDTEVELQENFTLRIALRRAEVRLGIRVGKPSETTIIINDDDEGKLQVF